MTYKLRCPRCNKELTYIEDTKLETGGFVSFQCNNGCNRDYIVPTTNTNLIKE